jgi:formylglycine-generating enzyme required for sulfatase activity
MPMPRKAMCGLPPEAEWEFACRAGTTTRFSFGDADADLEDAARHAGNSGGVTYPVGLNRPNAWSHYDMHGNVWEWVQDAYEPCKAEPATDPQGAAQGEYRVLRGGYWSFSPGFCRSAFRLWFAPDFRGSNIGFRVVVWASSTP